MCLVEKRVYNDGLPWQEWWPPPCSGTDIIRSESPEGPICDDLVFTILDDGGRGQGGSRRAPHYPISVRQLGCSLTPGC